MLWLERDGTGTLLWDMGGINCVSRTLGPLDKQGGLVQGLTPDGFNPHLGYYVNAGFVCIQGGNGRCTIQESKGILAKINLVHIKVERMLMGHPASELGLYCLEIIWTRIQKYAARPTAHPLQHAAHVEIHVQIGNVYRDDPRGMVSIQDHFCPNSMGLFDDRFHVQDVGTPKEYVRNGYQQRPFINRINDLLHIHTDTVLTLDHAHFDVRRQHPTQHVIDRWENAFFDHDFVALTVEIETTEQNPFGQGNVLMHRYGIRRGPDDGCNLVAQPDIHIPPTLAPGADTARGPGIGVSAQTVVNGARHSTQRVTDEISCRLKDRKFAAPMKQRIVSLLVERFVVLLHG